MLPQGGEEATCRFRGVAQIATDEKTWQQAHRGAPGTTMLGRNRLGSQTQGGEHGWGEMRGKRHEGGGHAGTCQHRPCRQRHAAPLDTPGLHPAEPIAGMQSVVDPPEAGIEALTRPAAPKAQDVPTDERRASTQMNLEARVSQCA